MFAGATVGGHRVVGGEQRTEGRPVGQIVAAVEQQLGPTVRAARALDRVPVTVEVEHERIAHLGDQAGSSGVRPGGRSSCRHSRSVRSLRASGHPGVEAWSARRCRPRSAPRRRRPRSPTSSRPASTVPGPGPQGDRLARSSAAGRSSWRVPSARCRAPARPGCTGRRRGSGRRCGRRRSGSLSQPRAGRMCRRRERRGQRPRVAKSVTLCSSSRPVASSGSVEAR